MALVLTDYTSYATIRALLGVGVKELPDSILGLALYATQTEIELLEIDGDAGAVLTQYAAILLISAGSRTATQVAFINAVNLFVAYSVARQLLTSSDMFAPQKIEDGHAALTRTAKQAEYLRTGISAAYAKILARLKDLLLELVPGAAVTAAEDRVTIVSVGLGTDPVTNT